MLTLPCKNLTNHRNGDYQSSVFTAIPTQFLNPFKAASIFPVRPRFQSKETVVEIIIIPGNITQYTWIFIYQKEPNCIVFFLLTSSSAKPPKL